MESNDKEQVMERRFAVRYEQLMAEAVVKPEALEGVLTRLDEFVKRFAASLKHDAQRQHAAEYVAGLVSNVKRKNIETIAYLHEQDRQPMQKFIGQRPWDETPMIGELVRQVAASIGRADGVLVIDPSGVLKQGKASVGVARQWCGRAGKVDNCQVGVYMAYVARDEQALVDAASLVKQVGTLMLLPSGENPRVYTVSDKTKLTSDSFFINAENGDKVLIYVNAGFN